MIFESQTYRFSQKNIAKGIVRVCIDQVIHRRNRENIANTNRIQVRQVLLDARAHTTVTPIPLYPYPRGSVPYEFCPREIYDRAREAFRV